ncbi:MAG: DsbA family protein [Gaiellaceae bacterium]
MATRPSSGPSASRRTIFIVIGVAALAAVALVAVALLLREDGGSSGSPTPVVDFTGIPQEGAVLGDPAATVALIEYADLQCPACREYAEEVVPTLVEDYVRPGRVKADFRGMTFIGPDSVTALRFVHAAGLQNRFWQLQEALYRNQGGENTGWVTDELVRDLAADIPGLDVDKLFADKDSAAVTELLAEDARRAQEDQVQATPTLLIQIGDAEPYQIQVGFDPGELSAALDDALSG